jgi:DNA (cytosine-5)-methyltransferase 1
VTLGVYYNEIDAYCAQWLRNLMDADLIPRGDIDTRSIEDVRPDELRGYVQCHFFAGLGGWPLALALAGWPSSRCVWTGSCPCQPFSAAGKGLGFADERHLWPSWQHLISQCEPPVIFGEQVASAIEWLGLVCGDLEAASYAVGHCPIEAASAGADHLRDRIWFVADASGTGLAKRERERGVLREVGRESQRQDATNDGGVMEYPDRITQSRDSRGRHEVGLANANARTLANSDEFGTGEERQQRSGQLSGTGGDPQTRLGWIIGHDGKARRVEPSIRLLAHGIPARVGKLRALGNAIDPRPAAAFIQSYIEARGLIADQQVVAA